MFMIVIFLECINYIKRHLFNTAYEVCLTLFLKILQAYE